MRCLEIDALCIQRSQIYIRLNLRQRFGLTHENTQNTEKLSVDLIQGLSVFRLRISQIDCCMRSTQQFPPESENKCRRFSP